MKMTPARWGVACALTCGLIAVMTLPLDPTRDGYTDYWWFPLQRHLEGAVQARENHAHFHTRLLIRNYQTEMEMETANKLFGAHRESAADPIVWFASDVPEFARRQLTERIVAERAARTEWRGHGAVGVIVETDTTTTVNGVRMLSSFSSNFEPTTAVLPPTQANGNHCVTIIKLGHLALSGKNPLAADRLPLDGCGFTDAFGAPGPKIAEWLRSSRYMFGRRYSVLQAGATEQKHSARWEVGPDISMQCRGGNDASCLQTVNRIDFAEYPWYSYRQDLSVPMLDESGPLYGEFGDVNESMLEALAHDLGPARFQRVWRSQKVLADAYFDETGEPFARWIRMRLVSYYGPYHTGPLPSPNSAVLLLVGVVAIGGVGIRGARRPYST